MGDAETITRNTGSLFIGEIVSRALYMLFFIVLARELGVSDFGLYSFVFAIASIFLIFSDMGLAMILVREVARDKAKSREYLSSIFSFKIFGSFVMAAAVSAFFVLFGVRETALAIAIVMLASFFNAITEPMRNTFLAYEKHHYYAMMAVFERAITTGLGLAFLLSGKGLLAVLWVFVISYAINFAVSTILVVKRFTRFSIKIDVSKWVSLLKKSWPFLLSALFITFYYRAGLIMLKLMLKSNEPAGFFNSAFGLVDALSFIPIMLVTAVFPAMSRFHLSSKESLKILYERAFRYLALVALPIAFGTTLLAGRIMGFLYTSEYSPAVLALQILIWSEVFLFFNYLLGYMLNAIDKQFLFTKTTAIYLLINIALNLFVIPIYEHTGVAAVAVVTQLAGFIMLLYYCSKNGYRVNLAKILAKPLIACLVMTAVIIAASGLNLFLILAAASLAYSAIILLVKGVGR
ncbi:flippase, partial [Candidatus Woesearchaeota archaeon]|nr:flippase [Candidatus Woesearchaeota archaeon]